MFRGFLKLVKHEILKHEHTLMIECMFSCVRACVWVSSRVCLCACVCVNLTASVYVCAILYVCIVYVFMQAHLKQEQKHKYAYVNKLF